MFYLHLIQLNSFDVLIIISIQFSRFTSNPITVRGIHKCFAFIHHGYSSNTLLSIHAQAHLHKCIRLFMAVHLGHSLHYFRGDGEIRTHDPLLARQVLSQLSYTPVCQDRSAIVTGRAPLERTLSFHLI